MRQRTIVLLASLVAGTALGANRNNVVQQQQTPNATTNTNLRAPEVIPYGALQAAKGNETKETRYVLKGTVERTDGDKVWIRSGGQTYEVDSAGLTYHRGIFSNDQVEAIIGGTAQHMQAFRILSPAQEAIAD